MPRSIETRITNLEKAALVCEGAHFGHRDLLARLLAKLPNAEVRMAIDGLIAEGQAAANELGPERLAGYCGELSALHDEVEHCRTEPTGLLSRLARSRQA